ncbi:sensor histidine kinase [Desulfosarcina ovata]|uniref:histidine kinase n=1 Tax=Desulfosarcina ovata subsp. ovata TaxID=2752305 RepID=A0A5K8A444_9BACT|nr:sensor histidine kinase [Desulfosarcina ovata]BBO87363.1 sodium:solute symporter [Desulfosarcina ovata subsp. ovata]
MLATETIIFVSLCYIGVLFGIAYYGDMRADAGRSIISNPYTYALSLAVYCTAWTFYGSVGRATSAGPSFLTIYLGPTLMTTLGWLVLKKIIRISKTHRITSIADFIGSRYGKSMTLGGLVTVIAVLGIVPYISLQLKAISTSFLLIHQYPSLKPYTHPVSISVLSDTTFYVALLLAIFATLFGTRNLEAAERHEGLVAAIAFESIVKLVAFLAVGIFITYFIFDGFRDIATRAMAFPELRLLMTLPENVGAFSSWLAHIFLSMMAIVFLPRQFQVMVVENVNETHLTKAIWMFPLYLLAINLFVLPVAFAGLLTFGALQHDPDMFVLALPMANGQLSLGLLVFIGGMSAATGMVILETVALSTMICNDLVMPALLHLPFLKLAQRKDLSSILLSIRRLSIVLVLLMGYAYFHFAGEYYTLVSIGLVSFAAVAQFAPAMLIGIFWKGGTKTGALLGLVAGFSVWAYTLFLPTLASAGLIPKDFLANGPYGIAMLKPFELFGLNVFDRITHAVFWSMLANIGCYLSGSLFSRPSAIEHTQAAMFVDVYRYVGRVHDSSFWRGTAYLPDLVLMLERFLGRERTEASLDSYAMSHGIDREQALTRDPGLVNHIERMLAGAIGSAAARVMVASLVKEEPLGLEEVMDILDETRQTIIYSQELERTTAELRAANQRLQELDRMKDDFISTVSHELRTPLTAIQSLAEILRDYPETPPDRQHEFSGIIISETQRLTRLITQVLDFQKLESGRSRWQITRVDLKEVVEDAVSATGQLVADKKIDLRLHLPHASRPVDGDRDKLIQALINLISNAVKFCDPDQGRIDISLKYGDQQLTLAVTDNGIGIRESDQKQIFDKFQQVVDPSRGRPAGTGLGLAITRQIIEYHHGELNVKSEPGKGATFYFTLPLDRSPISSSPKRD